MPRAYGAPIDCLVITLSSLAAGRGCGSGYRRSTPLVGRARLGDYHPGDTGHLAGKRHSDLVIIMHLALQGADPRSEPVA